jgi:hypothetical protein
MRQETLSNVGDFKHPIYWFNVLLDLMKRSVGSASMFVSPWSRSLTVY